MAYGIRDTYGIRRYERYKGYCRCRADDPDYQSYGDDACATDNYDCGQYLNPPQCDMHDYLGCGWAGSYWGVRSGGGEGSSHQMFSRRGKKGRGRPLRPQPISQDCDCNSSASNQGCPRGYYCKGLINSGRCTCVRR